jgi:hypothetical protein
MGFGKSSNEIHLLSGNLSQFANWKMAIEIIEIVDLLILQNGGP